MISQDICTERKLAKQPKRLNYDVSDHIVFKTIDFTECQCRVLMAFQNGGNDYYPLFKNAR